MTELNIITQVTSLGLGAVIAVLVLIWKRADDQRYQKYIEDQNKLLIETLRSVALTIQSVENSMELVLKVLQSNGTPMRRRRGR